MEKSRKGMRSSDSLHLRKFFHSSNHSLFILSSHSLRFSLFLSPLRFIPTLLFFYYSYDLIEILKNNELQCNSEISWKFPQGTTSLFSQPYYLLLFSFFPVTLFFCFVFRQGPMSGSGDYGPGSKVSAYLFIIEKEDKER